MHDLTKFLDFRLAAGGHVSPDGLGNVCATEAAIIAAGLEYRPVGGAHALPSCFSRVIGQFVIHLNDEMPDDVRQRLLPFVTRLAGTAASPDVEFARGDFLAGLCERPPISRAVSSLHRQLLLVRTANNAAVEFAARSDWDGALKALDHLLAIGAKPPSVNVDIAVQRLSEAREAAHVPA